MRIKSAVGSVVGETSVTRWSQVLTLPHAYAVVEVEDADGVARTHGVRLLTELTHRLDRKPVSLQEVKQIVADVFDEGAVTVAVLVPVGTVLYIVLEGRGTVFLKRKELLATLLTRPGGISGEVQPGDTVLVVTSGITDAVSREEIGATFDHLPAVEAAEKLTILLHQTDQPRFGAALVFQVAAFLEEDAYGGEHPVAVNQDQEMSRPPAGPNAVTHFSRRVIRRIKTGRIPTVSGIRRRVISVFKNPRHARALLTVFVISVFALSVFLGLLKQTGNRTTAEFEQAYALSQAALDEGLALRDLNPLKSRERIQEAQVLLEPFLEKIPEKTKEGQRLRSLHNEAVKNYQLVSKKYTVKPEMFYDVSLLKKDARAGAISLYEDVLGVVDVSTDAVYAVGVNTKSASVIGGGEYLRGMRLIGMTDSRAFVLSEGGIFEVPLTGTAPKTPVIAKDDEWGNIGALVSYGGNLYLLDTGTSRIWKYTGTDNGFTERREYLTADTLPDLSGVTGMSIDGSVYLGTMEGSVNKFTGGVPASINIQGVDPQLSGVVYVYTDDISQHIYLLEKQGKRVVAVDKEGGYVAQYEWEDPLIPSMFVVSETDRKVLLLADGLIYSFALE
jgi:hypothetical protein